MDFNLMRKRIAHPYPSILAHAGLDLRPELIRRSTLPTQETGNPGDNHTLPDQRISHFDEDIILAKFMPSATLSLLAEETLARVVINPLPQSALGIEHRRHQFVTHRRTKNAFSSPITRNQQR